jgi:hypothetical protein
MSVNLKWWNGKPESVVIAPPERDLSEVLHETLVETKSRFDELGAELAHFKREHAIVEFGHSHSIRGCRAAPGWTRGAIDNAWNGLWLRIGKAATNFHAAQEAWAAEKIKREKNNNGKAKRAS